LDLHKSKDVPTQHSKEHLLEAKEIFARVIDPSKNIAFGDRTTLLDSQKARHVIKQQNCFQ
jgi:hypothetical protein